LDYSSQLNLFIHIFRKCVFLPFFHAIINILIYAQIISLLDDGAVSESESTHPLRYIHSLYYVLTERKKILTKGYYNIMRLKIN